jgi:hypothetical protein
LYLVQIFRRFSSVDGQDQVSLFQILGVWWKDGCCGEKKEKMGSVLKNRMPGKQLRKKILWVSAL